MSLHIGCEIEFWADEDVARPAISEYYRNQWEVNNFHHKSDSVEKNIEALKRWVDKFLTRSKKGHLDFGRAKESSKSAVFSGVHIHIQAPESKFHNESGLTERLIMADRLGKIVMADVLRHSGLTARLLLSHHIHGLARRSEYSFKSRRNFQPVIYHREFGTYELRCIDHELLFTDEGLSKLHKILERSYDVLNGVRRVAYAEESSLYEEIKNLPSEVCTPDVVASYKTVVEHAHEMGLNCPVKFEDTSVKFKGLACIDMGVYTKDYQIRFPVAPVVPEPVSPPTETNEAPYSTYDGYVAYSRMINAETVSEDSWNMAHIDRARPIHSMTQESEDV